MAKPKQASAPSPANEAQSAFEEYRRRMDEGYREHLAQKASYSKSDYPTYVIGGAPDASPAPMSESTAGTSEHRMTSASAFEGLTDLFNLSLRTVNTTLGGWLNVMERFYGMGEGYSRDAEHEHCECGCEHDQHAGRYHGHSRHDHCDHHCGEHNHGHCETDCPDEDCGGVRDCC